MKMQASVQRVRNEILLLLGSWLHFLRIQPSGNTLVQTYASTSQKRSSLN